MKNKIDQADICELADQYTIEECARREIDLEDFDEYGNATYSQEAQRVFDRHYKLITETLGV